MATYSQYEQAWLEDSDSIKIVLVVAGYYDVLTSTEKFVYLSNASYITTNNTIFSPLLRRSVTLSETLNPDGSGAMTFGDLEIDNSNGELDDWLDPAKYIWSNRSLKVYYADPQWVLANVSELDSKCLTIFNGVTDVLLSRARNTLNLIIKDKLERLNVPVSDDKLGVYGTWTGGQQTQDSVKPIVFGEVFNTSPLLIDPAKLKYLFNNGITESLIEIRDNGMPLPTAAEVTGLTLTVSVTNGTVTGATISNGGTGFVVNDVVYIENANNFNSSLTSKAKFTANITSGSTSLVVTEILSGLISYGMTVTGIGIPPNTTITTLAVNGGVGTYTLSAAATATSTALSVEGLNAVATYRVDAVSGGVATSGTVLTNGSGYTAGVKTTGIFGIATTRKINVVDSRVGIFLLANQPSGTITCSVQGMKYSMNLSTGALVPGTYNNNIANIIALIVSQYGVPSNRFDAATEIDLSNFSAFSTDLPQPVSAYITDNTNILTVCRVLAISVSAGIFMSRTGKLKLLRYGTGFTGSAVTTVTEEDIIYNSLSISQKPPLIGCVKLAYAKNYTVQTGLLTSIASAHKDTMAEEWLTNTVVNSAQIAKYKLSQDVVAQTTNLIVSSDASVEAQKRLDYYSTQKTIYKFTGTSKLLGLELGQNLTLIHSRFNLYNSGNGYLGQVVSLAPNWSTGKVEVEVII